VLPTEALGVICPRLASRISQGCDEAAPALPYDRSAGE